MDIRLVMYTLAGGAAGFVLGATAASIAAAVMHMSRMEGGAGAFAAGIGLLTGLVGMVMAFLITLHSRGVAMSGLFRGTLIVVTGIVVVLFAARWAYLNSQAHFTKKYSSVKLEFELRPGAGEQLPEGFPSAELREGDLRAEPVWNSENRGHSGGVLSGSAWLYRLTRERELIVRVPNGPARTFRLEIPRDPSRASAEWSKWSDPATGAHWSIRYRVAR